MGKVVMVPIVDGEDQIGEYPYNTDPRAGPPPPMQIMRNGVIYTARWPEGHSMAIPDDQDYQPPTSYRRGQ